MLYARGLTVRSTSYHYIAASRDLSNKDSIKTGPFSGCGALKLSNTSVGCCIQQSPASCLGGRSMQQSPVSCLGGCSTQQSPVSWLGGCFTQQSPASCLGGCSTQQSPCRRLIAYSKRGAKGPSLLSTEDQPLQPQPPLDAVSASATPLPQVASLYPAQ